MSMAAKARLGILGVAAGLAVAGIASAQDAAPAEEAAAVAEAAPEVPVVESPAAESPAPDSSSSYSAPSSAPEEPAPFGSGLYVAPQFTYTIADSKRRGEDGIGGTLSIGSRLSKYFAVELAGNYSRFKNDDPAGGSSKFKGGNANVLLFPFPEKLPGFFTLLGGGYGRNTKAPVLTGAGVEKQNFNAGYFLGGVGAIKPLTVFGHEIALRADADYRLSMTKKLNQSAGSSNKSNIGDWLLSAGFMIPLFTPPPPAPPVEAPVEAPAVVPVAEVAPPPPEAPAEPAAPPCRTPIAGEKVDLSGCAVGDVIVLRGVNFEFNKATLTPDARTILDQVSDSLTVASSLKVELGGHTDAKGSDAYNQKLSQARAESVKTYLETRGVAGDRMTAKGYGESQPIADNDSDAGREQNRRVELKVTN